MRKKFILFLLCIIIISVGSLTLFSSRTEQILGIIFAGIAGSSIALRSYKPFFIYSLLLLFLGTVLYTMNPETVRYVHYINILSNWAYYSLVSSLLYLSLSMLAGKLKVQ